MSILLFPLSLLLLSTLMIVLLCGKKKGAKGNAPAPPTPAGSTGANPAAGAVQNQDDPDGEARNMQTTLE
ncbi:hypothetical protein PRIPAC_75009 [Pristionchus pacificus]|uniref:Uncharacterized protein n=1 Tax=Pristionchus pacificus TaxID=54126 RepID=A0A454Y3B7_PRIPA|nr:hypothetical protein PRIPAC_75009 [Pristionchus pacificus]|eukprot:PDM60882.1 hypothetical protein PRIPAC_54688 [Pristionchus pacificus]